MKITWIYQIQSKIKPERVYIGSSIDIKMRWVYHRRDLRGDKHTNRKLQNHYNKYGEDDFIVSTLVSCGVDELLQYEQFFLDSLNPYFNINKIAESIAMINVGRKHTKEHNQKIADAQMGENNSFYKKKHSQETKEKIGEKSRQMWDERKSKNVA